MRIFIAIVLLAIGQASFAGGPISTAGAEPPDAAGDAYATDGRELAKMAGISAAEGRRRLLLQDEIGSLDATARNRWPDTFAGLWIEHGKQLAVSVAFTADAAANVAELALEFSEPAALRPVAAASSLADLERRQASLITDREEARAGRLAFPGITGAGYDISIDIRRNAIVVATDSAAAATVAAFKLRYGPDVVVEGTGVAVPSACTRADCRPTLRSGLQLVNDGGGWCSSAFAARRWSSEWALLTAGHCAFDPVTGQWAKQGGVYYGYRETQQTSGNVDAEFHRVVYNGFNAQPSIFVTDSEQAREVRAKGSWANIATGSFHCKSGANSGYTCGYVNGKWFSPGYVPSSQQFVDTSYCSGPGDSGSGVFTGYKALGINSGYFTSGPCRSIWGALDFAENAVGAWVVTTTSTPYLQRISAVTGDDFVDVYFSGAINCSTVTSSDFSVEISSPTTVVLTDSYRSCSGSSGSVRLGLTHSGAPVRLAYGTSVRVRVVGLIESTYGNEISYPTSASTTVKLPPVAAT